MSKHVSRKKRWTQVDAVTHSSILGKVVFERNAWHALLNYRTLEQPQEGAPAWVEHERRLGPFRRPRDAMVALEREAAVLKNRHGEGVLLGEQPWDEA